MRPTQRPGGLTRNTVVSGPTKNPGPDERSGRAAPCRQHSLSTGAIGQADGIR